MLPRPPLLSLNSKVSTRPWAIGVLVSSLLAASLSSVAAEPLLDTHLEPQVHALVGARIVVAPGQIINSGTLVIRDGLIEAVGADLEPPADARVWQLDELTLWPGLIESFHTRPWPEGGEDQPAEQAGAANLLVRPERDMTLHAYDESAFGKLREAGFTTAVLVPDPGIFRGHSVVVNLGDAPIHDDILLRHAAINAQLVENSDGYPSSTMGAVALFRQTLFDAAWYERAHDAFEINPKQRRPGYSSALEALVPALGGRQPVVLEGDSAIDVLRLAELAQEFDLDVTLVGAGDEYQRLEEIRDLGLPMIVPVKFPKAPKLDGDDDKKVSLAKLLAWDLAPDNVRQLEEAGVDLVLSSHRLTEPKKLHEMLARSVERGYSQDQALAALTTRPAARLGMAAQLGTLEAGKIANVVISDGDLFSEDTLIRSVWIDGRRHEIKEVLPPSVDPLGTWEIVIQAGPQKITVKVTLTGTVEDLDGSIATTGGSLPLEEAYVSGDVVEFAMDGTPTGMPGTISFSMSVDGDSCSGTGTSPLGPFTFSGERTAKPEIQTSENPR